jgi:hypothetical protein
MTDDPEVVRVRGAGEAPLLGLLPQYETGFFAYRHFRVAFGAFPQS